MVLIIVTVVLLAYVGVAALLYFNQRALLYLPGHTRVDAASTDFALQRPDAVLRGWQVNTQAPAAVLYFGGNGENIEANRALFAQHCPNRRVVLLAYRGYGASDGNPSSQAIRDDALALFDEVRRQHPDAPISVVGRSLGSGVASWVASQRDVERLVLVTPFERMRDVAAHHYPWLPVRWLLREHYDSLDWLQGVSTPILVIRASHDEVIPSANTDALLRGLPEATRVITLQGNHNALGEGDAYARALCGFLQGDN